jgi:hypothetical protein
VLTSKKLTELVSVCNGACAGDNSVFKLPLYCCKDDLLSSNDKLRDRNAD